jgi:hypothetical protein
MFEAGTRAYYILTTRAENEKQQNNPYQGGGMKKVLALLSVGAAVAMMTGCGLSPAGAPEITIDPIPSIAKPSTGSTYVPVTGEIDADTEITAVSYQILTANDQPVSSSQISVSGPAAPMDDDNLNFDDYPIQITVYSTANPGDYKLRISVTAGPSADKDFNFTVTGVSTILAEKANIQMGADSAAPPSLLDAHNMTLASMSITDETRRGQIDVIFSFSTVLDPDNVAFTSPDVAAGSPYTTWANKAHAEYKLAPGGTTWASITTQADLATAWGTGAGASRMAVSAGNIIVIRMGASTYTYAAVQIVSITANNPRAVMVINGKY